MAIDVYWGSGSPYSWRVLLALEYKRLPYVSHLLHFDLQEHKSPQMLEMNPRGRAAGAQGRRLRRVRVAGGALLPGPEVSRTPPIFGRSPEEAGVIMRVIYEFQAYAEAALMAIVEALLYGRKPRMGRGADRRDARGGPRGAHHRGSPVQVGLDRRRRLSPRRTW